MVRFRTARLIGLALVVIIAALMVPAPTVANPRGNNGCTEGYWRNHFKKWPTGYLPTTPVKVYFHAAGTYVGTTATLLDAMHFVGGRGVEGAARALLRVGVPALLNAASGFYPYSVAEVRFQIDAALASGDRDTMLHWASVANAANKLGCPLD